MGRTLIIAITLFVSSACGGSPETPRDDLLGTWVVESAELLGEKAPADEAGGMKLEFHPGKATWHFRFPDGWRTWDGTLRYDPRSKEIDLSEPNNPDRVAQGIYKVEGDRLTIIWGEERPTNFEEPSLSKLVLKRE